MSSEDSSREETPRSTGPEEGSAAGPTGSADGRDAHEERLVVGLVRGIHGLKGAVRVEVLTDDPSRFDVGSVLHPEGRPDPLTVISAHQDPPGLLVRFAERATREAVESLRGSYLEVVVGEPLPEGAYYWHELMEVLVRTTDGEELGQVADVFRAGEGEVFVVRGGRRGELLVPAVGSVVREFAPRDGRIVVDAQALALDEPAEESAPEPRPRSRGRRADAGTRAAGRRDDASGSSSASGR